MNPKKNMKAKALIIMHNVSEGAGLFDRILEEKGWTREILPLFQGEKLPKNPEEYELILLMGGPMSVNDDDRYPFFKEEILFVKRMLKLGKAVMGICLGAQVMAKALGARVYPGPYKEIGWYFLHQTPAGKADPLFARLDPCFLVFQWHGETFDLPVGAVCLAGNRDFPHQAFRYGDHAYGLQFHFEVTEGMIKTWLKQWSAEIKAARPQPLRVKDILQDGRIYLERLHQQVRLFFGGYLDGLEREKKGF